MGTTAGPPRAAAVLTLIVLVLGVLAAGFLGDFSADPVMVPPDSSPQETDAPAPTATGTAPSLADGERIVVDGGTLAAVTLLLLMLALALLVRFLLRFRGRHGPDGDPPERSGPLHVGTVPLTTEALPEWARTSRAALAGGGSTSDTVIRCWLELERLCADAGVGRTSTQTTSEFASSVAVTLDLPSLPLTTLNRLYQRARFGQADGDRPAGPLGPGDRDAAAASLDQLECSLAAGARHPEART
ncbi:DUF4129 domain-containing protein [Arthrobacter sp. Ld5]|uniref:DUF4129 domain-containing protein n=1 Tax=Arthrobacter sp. Ld5 TaxID=649152 RepID=UPI003EB69B4F